MTTDENSNSQSLWAGRDYVLIQISLKKLSLYKTRISIQSKLYLKMYYKLDF